MRTWITVCDTCNRPETNPTEGDGSDGARLAELVERAALGKGEVRRFSCLMGCARACNVTVQAAGKIGYTLVEFQPTPEDAAAIADYAELHQESKTGQVPYRQWPQGVKGHFATRHPILPDPGP
mgnify:CR=1 FL=1